MTTVVGGSLVRPPGDEALSEMLTALKVPFGILEGVLVEPGVVANGKACGCLCPGCARPLIAYNCRAVIARPSVSQ
ncbi:MAG TPA: hypothetical protein VIM34_08945 [Burkholderiaceae bacterium]